MCGGFTCQRCGSHVPNYASSHKPGCALPLSTREAIRYSGLPVEASEAAIAAAEEKALEVWGQDYLRERRNEDALARAAKPNVSPLMTISLAGEVFTVGANGAAQFAQPINVACAPRTLTVPAMTTGPGAGA